MGFLAHLLSLLVKRREVVITGKPEALQRNYYNRGHLDKDDQLIKLQEDNNTFRESYLSIIITRKRNKQHGSSKSTKSPGALNQPNTINKRWPFKRTEESPCFLWGPSKCVTEAKNVKVSYIFDLRTHVSVKRGNGLLGVICKVSNRKALSGERFCFFEKRLLFA